MKAVTEKGRWFCFPGGKKHEANASGVWRRVSGEGGFGSGKGDKTLSELASHFEIHAVQVSAWRKELVDRAAELFEDGRKRKPGNDEAVAAEELYAQIGRLKMEVEWLKKKSAQLG